MARILVNSNIGLAPHLISFTADIPPELRRGADYLWMDQTGKNGKAEHICNKINGEKFLTEPGEHILSVLIITRDNQELRASTAITVLGPLGSR